MPQPTHTNRLAREKSPYLLQHAHNPVDWYPWGDDAFEKARREDKPVFLSVGYATCHWCHVMERESFENEEIAEILNREYVAIKVDREERPDVDAIYMNAVQAMTRHGGWPMSVWLTPEGKPFYGGTYFPPTERQGMPGFGRLLDILARKWREDRSEIDGVAANLTEHLTKISETAPAHGVLELDLVRAAARGLAEAFDPTWGGFGGAPKFPRPATLGLLMRHWKRTADLDTLDMVTKTLDKMMRGGIYDHVGGGFARYSVDEKWMIPHFEKMLYDNAQLVVAYLEGYQATGFRRYADLVREILAYVARDMTHPEGGFYSAQDADSEGVEGKYYVWDDAEVRALVGPTLAPAFCAYYNITPQGNFEGENNPWVTRSKEEVAADLGLDVDALDRRLAEGRRILFEARSRRIPPLLDDKVLTAWNGLMIGAYARAYDVLGDEAYLQAATRGAEFVERFLTDADGTHLLRRWRDGEARYAGYLNDYAFYTQGLLDLFEASGDPRRLRRAVDLAEILLAEYLDPNGGFFSAGGRNEALLVRNKDAYDGALPSGNSVSVLNLIRLADITGRARYLEEAERALLAFRIHLEKLPDGFPMMLAGVDALLDNRVQVVIAGDPGSPDTRAMRAAVWRNYLPNKVVAPARADLADLAPLVKDRVPHEGKATAYVCHRGACRMPTTDLATMLQQMGA